MGRTMVKVDPYSIVFLAMAVFFFLVRSVLRLRTESERSPVTDVFFYRSGLLVNFDKQGDEATLLTFTPPQPDTPPPSAPKR